MNGMDARDTAATTIFRGAKIIVGDGRTVHDRADLVVTGSVIADIREVGDQCGRTVRDAVVVDCRGLTIMPAIVSPHGHIGYMRGTSSDAENFSKENILDHLLRLAYHGISTFQSLGTDRDGLELAVRDEQRSDPAARSGLATLLSAGSGLVAPTPGSVNGGPFFAAEAVHETTSPEDATEFVRYLASRKVDMVKFWVDDRGGSKAKLSPDIQRAIVSETHRHGIKAAAHIYTIDDAKSALRAGADVLAHMPRSAKPDSELIDMLLEQETAVFTSISIQSPMATDWLDDPLVQDTIPAAAIAQLRTQIETQAPEPLFDTGETAARLIETFQILRDAGVRLVFSADTGLLAQLPGIAEHRELEALVHAGLAPIEAIRLATSDAADLLGLDDRGSLAAGKRADLLVLDADPTTDISRTRRINSVYLAGQELDRTSIRGQLQ